jgi:D-alanyl-D-alanine carboxypeptidase (penicillin-binding protein 5/6)
LRHRPARVRRLVATALASAALVGGVLATAPTAQAASAPTVSAKGAFLFDTMANRSLWGKAADTKRQMASTTKAMTATVVLGTAHLNLDRKVTVKKAYRDYVARNGASTADLKTGDKLTVRQLLYAMLLPSGCDAAMALADTYGTGSTVSARTESFIGKMNAKARSLGMTSTRYDSFDGISPAGNNYTTPRDMAGLGRTLLSYPTLRTVVKTPKTVQRAPSSGGGTRTYTWYNTNRLLGSYSGAIGIKTGTGTSAGPCLLFAATRGGRTVIGVTLHSSSVDQRYADAKKMLDYAFTGTSSSATPMKLRTMPEAAQRD